MQSGEEGKSVAGKNRDDLSGVFRPRRQLPRSTLGLDYGLQLLETSWISCGIRRNQKKKKRPLSLVPGEAQRHKHKIAGPKLDDNKKEKGKEEKKCRKEKKPITPDHQLHLPCKINRPRGHIDDTCIAMELPIIWGRHAKFVDAERNQIVTSSVVRSSKVLEVLFGELLACLFKK